MKLCMCRQSTFHNFFPCNAHVILSNYLFLLGGVPVGASDAPSGGAGGALGYAPGGARVGNPNQGKWNILYDFMGYLRWNFN